MTNNEALKLIENYYADKGFVNLFSPAFDLFKQTTITNQSFINAANKGLERFYKRKSFLLNNTKEWELAIGVVEQVNRERYQSLISTGEAA